MFTNTFPFRRVYARCTKELTAMEKIRYNNGAAYMRNTSTKEKQKTTKNPNKVSDIEAGIYIYDEAYHRLKFEDIPIKNLAAKTP
jgi:ribosomal protein L20A (L18A)